MHRGFNVGPAVWPRKMAVESRYTKAFGVWTRSSFYYFQNMVSTSELDCKVLMLWVFRSDSEVEVARVFPLMSRKPLPYYALLSRACRSWWPVSEMASGCENPKQQASPCRSGYAVWLGFTRSALEMVRNNGECLNAAVCVFLRSKSLIFYFTFAHHLM